MLAPYLPAEVIMRSHGKVVPFIAGAAFGAVLSLSLVARAGWNDPPSIGPDRSLLERLVRASEDTSRRIGDVADASRETARRTAESASSQAELVRAVNDIGRRIR